MEIKNGITYENNYARAAASFLSTCAPEPKEGDRNKAYGFITGIYKLIYQDATAVGYKTVPDVAFQPWEQQKGREGDIKNIRGAIAKIETLVAELFTIIEVSELVEDSLIVPVERKLSRTLKKVLGIMDVTVANESEQIKLTSCVGCFAGLKELALISRSSMSVHTVGVQEVKAYFYFSRCVFDPSINWIALAFDQLLDANGRLIWLCTELEKKGYKRVDCFDGVHISLDYVKQYGKKEEPIKQAWGERTHSGISVTFEELRLEPCYLWVRIPMFKTVLEHANELPPSVLLFIKGFTKTCNGCRYCVQTDKTKTRPFAAIKLENKKICPYFPGFTMNWRRLPQELGDYILDLLDAIDKIL